MLVTLTPPKYDRCLVVYVAAKTFVRAITTSKVQIHIIRTVRFCPRDYVYFLNFKCMPNKLHYNCIARDAHILNIFNHHEKRKRFCTHAKRTKADKNVSCIFQPYVR